MNARGGITAYEAWQWHQHLVQAQPEAYDPQVLARIKRGRLLSADDPQALYQQRADWKQRVERAVVSFDGLLMPTVPLIAPPLAELDDPERYTQVNLLMLRNFPTLPSARNGAGRPDAGIHSWQRCGITQLGGRA